MTHVDGTARPQLVERAINPLYHELIRRFGEASGHPVLLSSSFNLRGEPIVASAANAISTLRRSGLDVPIWGIIELLNRAHFTNDGMSANTRNPMKGRRVSGAKGLRNAQRITLGSSSAQLLPLTTRHCRP